ncbi:MAG: T9SS type A sorting domain-containing protein [Bacteroidetes bacterium]|nr:T9SS type A sorting domain-containing protein [Bacteroidota bacterium]
MNRLNAMSGRLPAPQNLRFFLRSISSLFLLVFGLSSVLGQTFSPDIIVALDGSGDFTSIQEAIDAVPDNSPDETIIYIKTGLYNTEKLIVPADKINVTMIGESRDETIISYHLHNCQSGGFNGLCPADDAMLWSGDLLLTAATLTINADNFKAENMTLENTAGPVGQAQAATIRGDRVIFINCNLTGYQDTIYFWSAAKRCYMQGCLITGRTDYIYGGGTVFFQECEVRSWGGGWITAPSTGIDQPHGFVFNECDITFTTGSPSPGDDNGNVALGRPWQNYPKVTWLYCEMTEKIDPLGWPTTWNMPYAPTSEDLHLYEYMNTGPGADMSGRADWVGIRPLEDIEAPDYTVQAVLNGMDGWDPTAIPPAVTVYDWTGNGTTKSWLEAENWDPVEVPDTTEAAYVTGIDTITADGGYFPADLNLSEGAVLIISEDSDVNYLAISDATIEVEGDRTFAGRLKTKDTIAIINPGSLNMDAEIQGVHRIEKSGAGTVALNSDNGAFSGWWIIEEGSLSANLPGALGESRGIEVASGATLIVNESEAFFVETPLNVVTGSQLEMNADITLSEFYIDGVIQDEGEYTASTNPGLISGSGIILVGRPSEFTFIGGSNGNWDLPEHFQPALLPLEGETVYNEIEMETTAFDFEADIIVSGGGNIRLRGVHEATGLITLNNGTSYSYATSGAGFTLNAPTHIVGEILLRMNSANTPSHSMTLGGPFSGDGKVTASNHRPDTENTGTVKLTGDNSAFTGIWDVTLPCENPNSVAVIEGAAANAFGKGLIEVGDHNLVALAHLDCAGDSLFVNLYEDGLIRLDATVQVEHAEINGESLAPGLYDASTNPEFFTRDGKLFVGIPTSTKDISDEVPMYFADNKLFVRGARSEVRIFNMNGQLLLTENQKQEISLAHLPAGIYLAWYQIDGQEGSLKVVRQ